jgi:DNA-binding HxlR family transcriptional regulator
MARNMLSRRLKKLVADGVIAMAPAADGSAYQEYRLTEKGEALLPVLIAMRQWGERFLFGPGESHSELVNARTGRPLDRMLVKDIDREECGVEDLALVTVA